MNVSIKGDISAVVRDLRITQPALVKKAVVTALNKTSAKTTTQFRREVSRETGIQQKLLRKSIKQYRANRNRLKASTWMGLRNRIPVSAVLKGRSRKLPDKIRPLIEVPAGKAIDQAFLASVRGRPATLFVREGRDRFPIKALKINLERIAVPTLERVGDRVSRAEFKEELRRDLQRRLNGFGTRNRNA